MPEGPAAGAAEPAYAPGRSAWTGRPERAALVGMAWVAALGAVCVAGFSLGGGGDAAVGALVGAGLALAVLAVTWVTVRLGRRSGPREFALLLVAGYGAKLPVVVLAVLLLRGLVGEDERTAFGVTTGLGVLLGVVVEAAVVTRTRAPYVET